MKSRMLYIRDMRMSEGVEWAIHCCTVLALLPEGAALPAARLAEFHGVPGPYLAKHLQALSRAGIVESVQGPRGGYRMARPAGEVTLLDVVVAVEGDETAFRCSEIRQRGPGAVEAAAYAKPCSIARAMWRAEDAWRRELAAQTVGDIVAGLAATVDPRAALKGAVWIQEVLSPRRRPRAWPERPGGAAAKSG
jgi:Rrf2 family protein